MSLTKKLEELKTDLQELKVSKICILLTAWSSWHSDLDEHNGVITSEKCNFRNVESDRNFFAANEDRVIT